MDVSLKSAELLSHGPHSGTWTQFHINELEMLHKDQELSFANVQVCRGMNTHTVITVTSQSIHHQPLCQIDTDTGIGMSYNDFKLQFLGL